MRLKIGYILYAIFAIFSIQNHGVKANSFIEISKGNSLFFSSYEKALVGDAFSLSFGTDISVFSLSTGYRSLILSAEQDDTRYYERFDQFSLRAYVHIVEFADIDMSITQSASFMSSASTETITVGCGIATMYELVDDIYITLSPAVGYCLNSELDKKGSTACDVYYVLELGVRVYIKSNKMYTGNGKLYWKR